MGKGQGLDLGSNCFSLSLSNKGGGRLGINLSGAKKILVRGQMITLDMDPLGPVSTVIVVLTYGLSCSNFVMT